jgi:hypothetical protein
MPQLMAEWDAEVDAISDEEFARAGSFLLCERPNLDVDLIFGRAHSCLLGLRVSEKKIEPSQT